MAVEPESRAPQVRVERASQSGGLHAGQILGQERYLLRERLGSGRAAAVWRAFDRMLTIDVAVKVLHPGLGRDAGHRETFFRRARKTAESDHDAVVRIVEPYGADRGHYYFVMELAVGGTLHTAVVERGVGPEQSIPWIMRTGDALSAAHRRGCMHLDIKPSNVLLTDEHEARLADFDLIIEADATADMIAWRWARGEASGAYLAPEQLDGSPRVVSGRADIYGLAMTTAFALHGHALPAQAARDTSAFMAGLHCAGPVRDVLTRATRHEPERRFAAMSDFCTALGDAWSQSASRAA